MATSLAGIMTAEEKAQIWGAASRNTASASENQSRKLLAFASSDSEVTDSRGRS